MSRWVLTGTTSPSERGEIVGHRMATVSCPYGAPDDTLWVREAFSHGAVFNADVDYSTRLRFRANAHDSPLPAGQKWRPAIFMPRSYSRLTLRITDVRVQRLQEISEDDAQAEGMDRIKAKVPTFRDAFEFGWDSINGKRAPWAGNPFVWALTFERVENARRAA